MLKRFFKLKVVLMASLVLAVMAFGSFDSARGQVVCEGVDFPTGWFNVPVPSTDDANFIAGLFGTAEVFNGNTVGGLDWLYQDDAFLNTSATGNQLISWWTQKNGRNTYLQVTNTGPGVVDLDDDGNPDGVWVHVQILIGDPATGCPEIRNFCDFYTPFDTHVYDLGNLVHNSDGTPIPSSNLQGNEGIIVVTPVEDCSLGTSPFFPAITYNFLQGNVRIVDSRVDVDYGTNVFARLVFDCAIGDPVDGFDCFFEDILPFSLAHNYTILGGPAGADVVLVALSDDYSNPDAYFAIGASPSYGPYNICDDEEHCFSCRVDAGCFLRIGVNDVLPVSEEFTPVPPSPTPTPCATDEDCPEGQVCNVETGVCEEVVTPTPTPTPTPEEGGGGGGGCAIAGGPVQAGTAMANILLPLIPAFAVGFRMLRRRQQRKSEEK